MSDVNITDVEQGLAETDELNATLSKEHQVAVGMPGGDDEISLAAIRLPQDFSSGPPTSAHLLQVPVGRPGRQEFFQVHPDESCRADAYLIRHRTDRDKFYAVSPHLICEPEIELEARRYRLYTYVSRAGKVGLWPVPLPDADGRENAWHLAAHRAAELAMTGRWIRLVANMDVGGYECIEAQGLSSDPQWPEEDLEKLLKIAFRERFIRNLDHPLLRQLRGDE
jgi:hypothetical protein